MKIYNRTNVELVKERLNFIELLNDQENYFIGGNKIKEYEDGDLTHPYKHFSALRIYLALTCFDVLGQPIDRVDFSKWLNSKKLSEERNLILEKSNSDNPLDSVKSIYNYYNKKYGARSSFNRFILEILSEGDREKLYKSISAVKLVTPEITNPDGTKTVPTGRDYELTNKQKLEFLYFIRNSFTHNAISLGIRDIGVFPKLLEPKFREYPMGIHIDKINNDLITYKVKNWPFVLIDVISNTINN